MLTPRQPEGCVPVVVSRCAQFALFDPFILASRAIPEIVSRVAEITFSLMRSCWNKPFT
jgi:hypothetical protein